MTGHQTLRLGWFATGTGTTSPKLLQAALDEIRSGRLLAEIAVVFCNREPGEDDASDRFHALVGDAELPLVTLSDHRFRRERRGDPARKGEPLPAWRVGYDREVMRLLEPYSFEIGLMAGYKLIFSADAAERWDLLNLHPAEPGGPKGVWQDVIWELIGRRADHAGAMVHLATPELDEGPPVTYCTYPLRGPEFDSLWEQIEGQSIHEIKTAEGEENGLFKAIRRHGIAREIPLVIATLRAFAAGRVRIQGKAVADQTGALLAAVDLSQEIEPLVAANA